MLRQYLGIKGQYPDAILFFRMGDFYEMFFEDASIASRILGITLTSRGTYEGKKVPMCGIPHHASRSYLHKMVKSGHKVAICEQVEDPGISKGIVKREVVRLVTPGSIVDEGGVDENSNLYLAAIAEEKANYGLAHVDLSTGEFRVTEVESLEELLDELGRIGPAELLIEEGHPLLSVKGLSNYNLEHEKSDLFSLGIAKPILKEQLGVNSLAGFGCEEMTQGVIAAGVLAHYLTETQKGKPQHVKDLVSYRIGDFMFLDEATCSHLELHKTMRRQSSKGSLFQIMDKTVTPMGGRLLKKWIVYPLINLGDIRNRLAAVDCIKKDPMMRHRMRSTLGEIYDLERLNGRIALGRANARDMLALRDSLLKLPEIKETLKGSPSTLLSEISSHLDTLQDVAELILNSIHEDPPVSLRGGRIIKEGYNRDLDRLISLSRDGKSWISSFAEQEQRRTGISSLKVGYNKVFGYYIEISKTNLHLAPTDYIRKQTLVNGERYITEDLKKKEEEVLGAEEKRVALEYELFDSIRRDVASNNLRIRQSADLIAKIDVLSGLAEIAELNNYVRPEVNEDSQIFIEEGRHPVIELSVKEETFVPNDIMLDSREQQLMIITGPNMAGKSTILRQTALTVLMAQMGSFVPASRASIGLVDRIFTRVGASDDLARGQSTFMVEMNETANILRHSTPKSLVILDEIGRGTSTYDGLSIAWAVAESLHDRDGLGVRTLFATHYHELTELAAKKQRIKNYNIAVKEWNDKIIFLRKLVPGETSRSYGIQVARIAGLPEEVLKRAGEILEGLEDKGLNGGEIWPSCRIAGEDDGLHQLSLFRSHDNKISEWLRGLEISSMTPLEALMELNRLKESIDA